jgi:cell division protein FtsI/penicillin-binding protein 2
MQKDLEEELDILKNKDKLYEASSVVLDLDNGVVKGFASSNRYNPSNIRHDTIDYLSSSVLTYLFKLQDLYIPIKSAFKDEDENFYGKIINLKKFGLLSSSNINIMHEQKSILTKGEVRVNFFKVLKAYSVFYNKGILKEFRITNKKDQSKEIQVISHKKTKEIRVTLADFYKKLEEKEFDLKFKTHAKKAKLKFTYFEEGNKRYLKGDFIIHKKKKYYACKNEEGYFRPLSIDISHDYSEHIYETVLKKFVKENKLDYDSCYSSDYYKK